MKMFSILTCILATWAVVAVNAQSPENAPSPSPSLPSPAPTADCLTIMMDMMPCLNFLEAGSDLTMPDASCCSGFKQVLNADPDCICVALAKSASFGIIVNMTQAAALPSDCGVSAPPLSNCNSTTPPSASPDNPPSPVNPPTEQPAASPTSESPATAPTVDDEAPVEAPNAESSDSTINLTASFLTLLVITAASVAFSIIMVA
ncbi:non-specific lipid transfer protein GPI-anchored 4-like [Lycium ferocissimum]|uniref:non-specific lipid transfer protein GPI-anchored 4-like n=1 Tax=Lycium ferocissimum TaxID=112874 RepID=UPI002814F25D|nr:non-specific lipid transfer protein GPI-anchored 4-like [Lycium ferocissimum]